MKKLSVLVCYFAIVLHGQKWTNLGTGSQLVGASPQNCANTGPAYCTDHGGIIYNYADQFKYIMEAWNGAVGRTKPGSEQLIFPGGGHNDYMGNGLHAINLYTHPATVTMIRPPGVPIGSSTPTTVSNIICQQPNYDNSPLSQHMYQNWTYLKNHDELFFWAQGKSTWCLGFSDSPSYPPPAGGDPMDRQTWTYSFATDTWTKHTTTGFDPQAGNDGAAGSFAAYYLDPATGHDTVFVGWGTGSIGELLQYDRDTDTWYQRLGFGSGIGYWPAGASAAIDPVRKLMVWIGANDYTGAGALRGITVDISGSPWTVTDITSSLSGCPKILNPGLQYDDHNGNFKMYSGTGNDVVDFDPSTGTCTTATTSGGPTGTASAQGVWGKWQYFPTLKKFAITTAVDENAFLYDPGTPPVITTPASPGAITDGTQLSPYTYTFAAFGTDPFTWSITAGSLPTGISLNTSTGEISGTPTGSGTFSFSISVANGYGSPATSAVTLYIGPVCLITSTTLPNAKFRQIYSQLVPTAGCVAPTFSLLAGLLPSGLALNTSGVISGRPGRAGLFPITIGVTDIKGNPSQAFGLIISPGPGVRGVIFGPNMVH